MAHPNKTDNDEQSQPEVEIFGSKIRDERSHCRHHHSGRVIWGAFLLIGGVMLLLNNLNLVPWQIWDQIWQYWPVIFILFGFQIILGESYIAKLVMSLITLILVGLVFLLSLYHINSPIINSLPPQIINILNILGGYRI
jgi:hypothetical protein